MHITYVAGPDNDVLLDAGSNSPDRVAITYCLRDEAAVDLTVFDADGAHVATLSNPSSKPGMHRIVFDLRYPGATCVEGGCDVVWC